MEKLIYLVHTRLDLAYAVSVLSQFMHDMRVRHMKVVDRVLQYLKATPKIWHLFKRGGSLTIKAYTNVDYVIEDLLQTIVFSGVATLLLW